MASTDGPKSAEPTFRNYAPAQAKLYAQYRGAYPPQLLKTIIDLHKSTSPDPATCLGTVVDVGCGPGTATHYIGPYFERAIGLDPGESMIATARSLTRSGGAEFAVSGAEGIDQALLKMGAWDGKEPCVDLVTAATAAHWFDMPLFYSAAAKVLKPGGSIILWCNGSSYPDCEKYGGEVADKAKEVMMRFEEAVKPYELEGNRICRELYKDIVKPWDVDGVRRKELGIDVFDEKEYARKTWNEGGKLEDDLEGGWMRKETNKWAIIKYALGTASPVTRFREQNKEALERGEMEDIVDRLIKDLREVLGQDKEEVHGGMSTAVLIFKKSM